MSINTYLSSHESEVFSESVALTPQTSSGSSAKMSTHGSTPASTQSSTHVSIEETGRPSQEDTNQKMILKHIDGYASTGEMTAILGARLHYNFSLIPSGAGKTGQFSINGREVGASSLRSFQSFLITNRKVCRFVRQHDLFYEFLTVQEHLYYQAILRLGDKGEQQIRDRLVWVCLLCLLS